jgi:hypothetical protein
MKNHIQIVSILHIAMGIISLLGAIAIFLFVGVIGGIFATQGEPAVGGIIGILAVIVGGFLAVLALPGIIGGWALMTGRSWGRIVVLIVAALHIMNVPFGTALGVYTFWALMYEPQQPALGASTVQPGA